MKSKFTWKSFEIGIVALSLVLHLVIALSPADSLMHWYSNDDAYYYFKVAANLTSGHGMTFDGINRTNGFQPLWMLVCIAIFWIAKYDLVLPLRLLLLVSAVLNAGTGILIFRTMRKFIPPETAAIPAMIWIFLPYIHANVVQGGLESGLSAFLVAFLIYLTIAWRRENLTPLRLVGLGVVAGLAILARLDNIFVVLLLGVWFALGFKTAYLRTVITGDLAFIFIVGLLSYFVGLRTGRSTLSSSASLPWLVGLGFVVQPIIFFLCGMYTIQGERVSWKFIGRTVLSTALATTVISLILAVLRRLGIFTSLPLFVILLDLLGTWAFALTLRLLARLLFAGEEVETLPPVASWKFWETPFKRSLGYFIPIFSLFGSYMLWSYLYFGTPMPVSGLVKYWWGTIYISLYGSVKNRILPAVFGNSAWGLALSPFRSITGIIHTNDNSNFLPILIKVVAACLLLALIISQRKWVIKLVDPLGLFVLFAGLYAQIFSYTSTSYWDIRDWYWVSEMLFTVICLGVLLECVHRLLQKFKRHAWIWQTLLVIVGAGCVGSFVNMLWHNFPYHLAPEQQQAYLEGVHVLEADTETGTLIGIKGGGEIGYFIQGRTVVNLDGLINSYEYFQSLRDGKGASFLDKLGLDYVIGYDYMLATSPYRETLSGRLIAINPLDSGTTLYRYVPSP